MAKKIKFPLKMKNGSKVHTMEELKENFDGEKVVSYYLNGKLENWLRDRNYTKELNEVANLDKNQTNLAESLFTIFGIRLSDNVNIEINKILKNQELEKKIRQYTDEEEILNNLDLVVLNQKELTELLQRKEERIYLLGDKFTVPSNISNVVIYGINKAKIHVNTKSLIDFDKNNVKFVKCEFDEEYSKLVEEKRLEEENKNKKRVIEYKVSSTFDYLLSNNDREKSKEMYLQTQKNLGDFEFDIDYCTKEICKALEEADLTGIFDIGNFGKDIKVVLEDSELDLVGNDFFDRIS